MKDVEFSIVYHPLSGEKASYSGMAEYYRNTKEFKKSQDSVCALNFVGGVMATESFLGIPYDKEFALTTINDVNKIYNDFSENSGNHETTVILSGFGKGLMSVGEVASGFSVSAEVGSESELNKLAKSFNKNNIYVDYDVVNFSNS
jgi:hypothetical protein